MRNSERIHILDFFRGFAALYVVFFHYLFRSVEMKDYNSGLYPGDYVFAYGWVGVQIFFVLSGFVIFYSIENKSSKDFLLSRFYRIYPMYWICLITSLLFIFTFNPEWKILTITEILINFTLLQGFIGVEHVDGVYWTLVFELMFYFWVLIFIFFSKIHLMKYFLLLSVIFHIIQSLLGHSFFHDKFQSIFLVSYSSYFLIGLLCYEYRKRKVSLIQFCIVFLLCILSVYFELLSKCLSISERSGYSLSVNHAFVQFCIFISLFLIFVFYNFKITFDFKIFKWLGMISFPVYLLHQNLGYILIGNYYEYYGIYSILFSFVLVVSVSTLYAYIIEPMFTKNIQRVLRNYGL